MRKPGQIPFPVIIGAVFFFVITVIGLQQQRYANGLAIAARLWRFHDAPCSLRDAVRAGRTLRIDTERTNEIARASVRVRTDLDGSELWRTPDGEVWMPSTEFSGIASDLAEQRRSIYGPLHPGEVVLDCGAHVGLFARKAVAAGAKVIAIEPDPDTVVCLRKNLAPAIAAGHVVIYPKGVWDRPEMLTLLRIPRGSRGSGFVHSEGRVAGPTVPLTTIDTLVAELGLTRVDLIKMDIEGAEPRALLGARGTISRFHPRLAISAYHDLGDEQAIRKAVAPTGYRNVHGEYKVWGSALVRSVLFFTS